MIEDLSNSIRALLEYELLTPGQEIIPGLSISFAQPDQNFPPASVTKPAVNIFLYDVREDLKLRHNEWFRYAPAPPAGCEVRRQPVLIECSYLVTAWSDSATAAAHDEHTVLSVIIKALRRYNDLPNTLPDKSDPAGPPVRILQGGLAGGDPQPRAFTIQDGYLQSLGEFWRSMGHGPKPRFNYSVTIAADVRDPIESGQLRQVNFSAGRSDKSGPE